MYSGWQITCGKCGEKSGSLLWLDSPAVLTGKCHFKCPACGVMIKRVARGVQEIDVDGVAVFVPGNIKIEEVAGD